MGYGAEYGSQIGIFGREHPGEFICFAGDYGREIFDLLLSGHWR